MGCAAIPKQDILKAYRLHVFQKLIKNWKWCSLRLDLPLSQLQLVLTTSASLASISATMHMTMTFKTVNIVVQNSTPEVLQCHRDIRQVTAYCCEWEISNKFAIEYGSQFSKGFVSHCNLRPNQIKWWPTFGSWPRSSEGMPYRICTAHQQVFLRNGFSS